MRLALGILRVDLGILGENLRNEQFASVGTLLLLWVDEFPGGNKARFLTDHDIVAVSA